MNKIKEKQADISRVKKETNKTANVHLTRTADFKRKK